MAAFLGNFKLCRMAQVVLYNRESRETNVYRKLLPGGGWKMPRSLAHGTVECRFSRFNFRIHAWLNADTVKMDLDIEAARKHPALTAHLAFCLETRDFTPAVVSLNFSDRRNMYAYKSLASVRGDIVLGGRHFSLYQENCSGVFCDYKGFFPYPMKGLFCCGIGFDGEGRRYGFHIAENQARETRKNNENALWVDGRYTPLPPVRITMPCGPESDWVIQDLDGMVDLVFTPDVKNRFYMNIFATRADFYSLIGNYNGIMVDETGEQVQVRNLRGSAEKLYMRV